MARPNPKNSPARAQAARGSFRHEAESDDVHPKIGGPRARTAPPPKIDESPAFLFTHHHERWLVMGGHVIPALGKLKFRVGLQGVDENQKTGELIAQHVIDTTIENGKVVIPVDVDGPGTTYLKRPKGTNAVISKFEKVYAGSNQVDCDEPAYIAWCESLIERGIIEPPPPYVLERMRARLERELEDLADVRSARSYRKRLARDLAAVQGALSEVAPEAESEDFVPDLGKAKVAGVDDDGPGVDDDDDEEDEEDESEEDDQVDVQVEPAADPPAAEVVGPATASALEGGPTDPKAAKAAAEDAALATRSRRRRKP